MHISNLPNHTFPKELPAKIETQQDKIFLACLHLSPIIVLVTDKLSSGIWFAGFVHS